MKYNPRHVAIQIAEAIHTLNKESEQSSAADIATKLNVNKIYLQGGHRIFKKAFDILKTNHFIVRDVARNWRMNRPMEDVVYYLQKWQHGEKEPEGDRKTTRKLMQESNLHKTTKIYQGAKSIELKVNDVTITINFNQP